MDGAAAFRIGSLRRAAAMKPSHVGPMHTRAPLEGGKRVHRTSAQRSAWARSVSLMALAILATLSVAPRGARAEDPPYRDVTANPLRAGQIQEAARRIDAARRGIEARDDPFELLGQALRETLSALRDLANPTAKGRAADPTPALERHAAQFRRRCTELRPVAQRKPTLAAIVSQLEDRCARLLAAIDEIRALPGPQARSERALVLLGELAAAGPRARDPRRAPPEPTIRGVVE